MLCEDVEDDGGAVDHLHFGGVFQCASLARRQIIVDDDGVRLVLRHDAGQFARLAGTHVCGRIRLDAMLQQTVAHHGARGFGERGEFSERFLGRGLRGLAAGPYAYEHDAFEPDFTVFDFGDVLDLAQTRHMLQCVAGFAFLPLFVVGFAKVFPAVGIKQHVGLVGEHSPDVACGHALLDIVLLAQWHLSRLNYGVFIIIIL